MSNYSRTYKKRTEAFYYALLGFSETLDIKCSDADIQFAVFKKELWIYYREHGYTNIWVIEDWKDAFFPNV